MTTSAGRPSSRSSSLTRRRAHGPQRHDDHLCVRRQEDAARGACEPVAHAVDRVAPGGEPDAAMLQVEVRFLTIRAHGHGGGDQQHRGGHDPGPKAHADQWADRAEAPQPRDSSEEEPERERGLVDEERVTTQPREHERQ